MADNHINIDLDFLDDAKSIKKESASSESDSHQVTKPIKKYNWKKIILVSGGVLLFLIWINSSSDSDSTSNTSSSSLFPTITESTVSPTPTAYLLSDNCSNGCVFKEKCLSKPTNSHCVSNDAKNAWKCDSGYIESSGLCVDCSNSACNSSYSGSKFSYYDKNKNSCICDCPSGYFWNDNRTACIPADQSCSTTHCRESYSNSVFSHFDYAQQKCICDCPYGYQWNSSNTACVNY